MGVTPTEWAAIIAAGGAILGAAVGGIVAGVVTYKTTARQVTSSEGEGDKQRNHDARQRELDRIHEGSLRALDRRYDRRADASLVVTRHVLWIGDYSTWQKRMLIGYVGDTPLEPPPRPAGLDEASNALAALFLPDSTAIKVRSLNEQFRTMQQQAAMTKEVPPGEQSVQQFHAAHAAVDQVLEAVPDVLVEMFRDLEQAM